MNYVLFICSDHKTTPEELAAMRREVPGWVEEMDGRRVRVLGRELEFPETAVTVRVRDGENLVSDGPFAETKELMAGLDLLECADLDEAIEVAAKHPTSWFHMIEVRPFRERVRLGEKAFAFAREDDSAGRPYLLSMWMSGTPEEPYDDRTLMDEVAAWRREVETRGLHVLGSALEGTDTATTVRVREGKVLLSDGPFIDTEEFIAGIDIVSCRDRQQAIELGATHPLARYHAIEVRPFYSE